MAFLPEVFLHQREHDLREEFDILSRSLEGASPGEISRGLQQLHVDGCAVQVLQQLLEQTVGEATLDGSCGSCTAVLNGTAPEREIVS